MIFVEFLEFLGRLGHLAKIPEEVQKEILAKMNDGQE